MAALMKNQKEYVILASMSKVPGLISSLCVSRVRWLIVAIVVILGVSASLPSLAHASTNINSNASQHWAWDDFVGWIDLYTNGTITVSPTGLTGYASSSVGDISLDCHTTRIGNICGRSNYQVTNDGAGNLSGWGWNDSYGWISFDCHNNAGCGTSSYRVYIDSSGNFQNFAWNDIIGWIDFNCDNIALACSHSNYEAATSWVSTSTIGTLDSTTFDTGIKTGAQLNSLLWYGNLPAGTSIGFQFADQNSSSGPWNFVGPDGTLSTFYSVAQGTPLPLSYSLHSGYRYFRYRVTLTSDLTQQLTPRVDEVIVNWSP